MTEPSNGPANRRPLASRDTGWARALSRRLAATAVTPNQISQFGLAAAILSGGAFWLTGTSEGALRVVLLLTGALFCQVRLLCNLIDGMVAVEGGKQSPDGAFWNEMPDRLSDAAILVGVGYGAGAAELGWATAMLAVLTAYVRELGRAEGAKPDFCGPMAKPHRMFTVTLGALIALFEPLWGADAIGMPVLEIALWVIAAGTAITVARRSWRLLGHLRRG